MRICRDYVQLHYRLLPYLWATARDCVARALPVSCALVLAFPDDPTTWSIGDQWLFGESILVAPILDASDRRRVYLPEGSWTDWWTGEHKNGPRWIDVEASLERLPLWLREGAVIPMAPVMQYVDQKPLEALVVRIAPLRKDGRRELRVPTAEGDVMLRYRATGGRHTLSTDARIRIDIDVVGIDVPEVHVSG